VVSITEIASDRSKEGASKSRNVSYYLYKPKHERQMTRSGCRRGGVVLNSNKKKNARSLSKPKESVQKRR